MTVPTLVEKVYSSVELLSTELNSLANNALVLSSVGGSSGAFTNYQADGVGNGCPMADLFLTLAAPGGTLTANTVIDGWFLAADDGTNYEAGSASVTPARAPDFVIPVIASSAAMKLRSSGPAPLPPLSSSGLFKVLLRNNGTGQALAASGNTLYMYPITDTYPTI